MVESYLLRGLLIGLIFGVPAGAIGALTIQRTLNSGFFAGLTTGLGSSVADLLYACAGVFGITLVSDFLARHQRPISLLGGLLIVALGICIFHQSPQKRSQEAGRVNLPLCFASSFAIAITNPATVLSFLMAFAAFEITGEQTRLESVQLIAGILLGTLCWWSALSGATAAFRAYVNEMKQLICTLLAAALAALAGCGGAGSMIPPVTDTQPPAQSGTPDAAPAPTLEISPINELEDGFSSAQFAGDDGFEDFLTSGGASSDGDVIRFLAQRLAADFSLGSNPFGCSTLAVQSPEGHALFGRNFDWQSCDALVLTSKPTQGYASISTVNLDFIRQGGGSLGGLLEADEIRVLAALYAPLDGMNEKGLAVSVNMIQDSASIRQDTGKPDLTTTTAVRLLLNQAASVDEAVELLGQYDLHASMGMMVHFALADNGGNSVVVEYIDNEMVVTQTPVVTNFYLAEGEKHGIGTRQSHERFDRLTQALADHPTMTMEDVRDALDSVSKDNFNEFESTEWSAVFDLDTGEAHYYHRENYKTRYTFSI